MNYDEYVALLRKAFPPQTDADAVTMKPQEPDPESLYQLAAYVLSNLERLADAVDRMADSLDKIDEAIGFDNDLRGYIRTDVS